MQRSKTEGKNRAAPMLQGILFIKCVAAGRVLALPMLAFPPFRHAYKSIITQSQTMYNRLSCFIL